MNYYSIVYLPVSFSITTCGLSVKFVIERPLKWKRRQGRLRLRQRKIMLIPLSMDFTRDLFVCKFEDKFVVIFRIDLCLVPIQGRSLLNMYESVRVQRKN